MNFATIKAWVADKLPTVRAFVILHKKWFIGAALLLAVWLPISACSHKVAPKPEPVKIERTVQAPYTVTKTDPKLAPIVKAKHKKHRHGVQAPAPAPAPKCYFFLHEYDC